METLKNGTKVSVNGGNNNGVIMGHYNGGMYNIRIYRENGSVSGEVCTDCFEVVKN